MTDAIKSSQRLRAEQAAQYLGLSASTLAKLRIYGNSPRYMKLGRRVVYNTVDLDAWLTSHLCRSTSEYARGTL